MRAQAQAQAEAEAQAQARTHMQAIGARAEASPLRPFFARAVCRLMLEAFNFARYDLF